MPIDPFSWIEKNWQLFLSAPAAFGGLAAIMLGTGYAIGTYFKNGEIAILERRIAEYESKLKVGSPEEAKTQVDQLRGELAALNKILGITVGTTWDPLNSQEISDLSIKLRGMPKHRVQIMYLNQLGRQLAETLHQAFVKAEWVGATVSPGGGSHLGIIAGAGADKAASLKNAIEATTRFRVILDKPEVPEWGDLVYLFVGINPPK